MLAPYNLPEAFRNQDVIWFIDNEAAAAALIRGGSGSTDVDKMAQIAHHMFLQLNARVWVEWINSDANPADGLSREGFLDSWTKLQPWELRVPEQPDWDCLDASLRANFRHRQNIG